MDHPHILSEKLRIPTATGLRRRRLEELLLDSDGPGLVLVCAPAGSGKSTLLASVAARSGLPVAWYRMAAEDGVSAFPAHLSAALGHAVEGINGAGDTRIDGVDELLTRLDRRQDGCLLVLDDAHELIGTPAERALARFLSLRPRCVRVILGCRRPPDLNLPMLRSRGELREVTADDLRFRVWEVEELFAAVHQRPLNPESAAALTSRTGGWAAGLQLFHLATADKNSAARQQAVQALGPRAKTIRGYLARNVLEQLDEVRRYFLVHTSALGLLSGPLCDALLDRSDSAAILEALERDQIFTTSEDDGLTYRYHEVLQRHLELALVSERGIAGARRWYARAADLLVSAGAVREALRAYALAEDWASVAVLGRRESSDVTAALTTGNDDLLPAAVLADDPWLALADARRRLRRGAVAQAVEAFRRAASLSDEAVFRQTCAREAAVAAAWMPRPSATVALDRRPRPSGWTDQLREAIRMDRFSAPQEAGPLEHGLAALLRGSFTDAERDLQMVAEAEPEVSVVGLAAELGVIVAAVGARRPVDGVRRFEEIADAAANSGYPWIERISRGLLLCWLAATSAAPWSLTAAGQLRGDCERDEDVWGAAILQLATGIAMRVRGDGCAAALLTDAAARFRALDAAVLARWPATLNASLANHIDSGSGQRPDVPPVTVRCLGGFEITVDGCPLDLGPLRPRALTLLHVLALNHGAAVHRERLIDLLWPDASLPVGVRRLQVAVSSVRQVLAALPAGEGDVLRRTGDSYMLRIPTAIVDLHRFDDLLTAADAEKDRARRTALRRAALELYGSDLLPEAGAAEHVVPERERLRVRAAAAAAALAADHLAEHQPEAAAAASRRSLELDRYSDAAWRLLVAALQHVGDDAAAARARLEHEAVLDELEQQLA